MNKRIAYGIATFILLIIEVLIALFVHDAFIRPYIGDYHYNYDPLVVDAVLDSFRSWKDRPMACSIDFGVTSDNKTVVIEINDAYALGNYGLHYLDYAKLISARWSQLLNREDEFDFRK